MSQTYDFMVALARAYAPPPARLLDFGCGGGEIVGLASAAGFDAFGVDTFEDMWDQYQAAASGRGDRILRVSRGEPLPFENDTFDLVVSNQVFEHISDLAPVGSELARVLRPGGVLIAIFPTQEILIEPHLKAPLVHWFTPGSAPQRTALHVSHALKLCNRPNQERQSWVNEEQYNLQKHIFYRTAAAAIDVLNPWFDLWARDEAAFLRHRLALHPRLTKAAQLPRMLDPLLAQATLRLANAVLIFRCRAGV